MTRSGLKRGNPATDTVAEAVDRQWWTGPVGLAENPPVPISGSTARR
jgi:hypothetical protein